VPHESVFVISSLQLLSFLKTSKINPHYSTVKKIKGLAYKEIVIPAEKHI
jgi:hypothetical protein